MTGPRLSLTPYQRQERLRLGLVGNRATLYRLSPSFKAQIDALAHLLEPMIDGLAQRATDLDSHLLALEKIEFPPGALDALAEVLTGDDTVPESLKLDRAARDSEQSGPGGSPREE